MDDILRKSDLHSNLEPCVLHIMEFLEPKQWIDWVHASYNEADESSCVKYYYIPGIHLTCQATDLKKRKSNISRSFHQKYLLFVQTVKILLPRCYRSPTEATEVIKIWDMAFLSSSYLASRVNIKSSVASFYTFIHVLHRRKQYKSIQTLKLQHKWLILL